MPNVTITGQLAPTDELLDTYPTHSEEFGKGGYRTVASTTERNAIPADRRSAGMLVRCTNLPQDYRLLADLTTWEEADAPTAEDSARAAILAAQRGANLWSPAGTYLDPADYDAAYTLNADTQAITTGNQWRVERDLPEVEKVQFYFGATTNVTKFEIVVWRRQNFYWYIVDKTDNLLGLITQNSVNTITLPRKLRGVRVGDHIGWGFAASSYPNNTALKYKVVGGAGNRSVVTVQASVADAVYNLWNLGGTTNQNDLGVPIRLIGKTPDIVSVGDSLTAGSPQTRSLIEAAIAPYFDGYDDTDQYTYYVGTALGMTWQNMGISSQTSAQVLARFDDDVVANYPKIALIMAGTNDIPASVTQAAWLANMTSMIDKCIAARIYPVVLALWPRTDWCTPSTYWASRLRVQWNDALEALIGSTYWRKAMYVNCDSTLGEYYSGGDPGNLDKLQAAYNADSVHLTQAGYQAAAGKIVADLQSKFQPL